jgi:hypothetical protein
MTLFRQGQIEVRDPLTQYVIDLVFELEEGYSRDAGELSPEIFEAHKLYCQCRNRHLEEMKKADAIRADNEQRGRAALSKSRGI